MLMSTGTLTSDDLRLLPPPKPKHEDTHAGQDRADPVGAQAGLTPGQDRGPSPVPNPG